MRITYVWRPLQLRLDAAWGQVQGVGHLVWENRSGAGQRPTFHRINAFNMVLLKEVRRVRLY